VLTYASTIISSADVARRIAEENAIENVAKPLESLLYAGRSSLKVEAFRKMVSNS
jgi:hypothetical protein